MNGLHDRFADAEAGITDESLDSERFSLPDLNFTNLRASHNVDEKVGEKSLNLGRHSNKKCIENHPVDKGNFKEGNSKFQRKQRNIQERTYHEPEQRRSSSKNKSPQRVKEHFRAYEHSEPQPSDEPRTSDRRTRRSPSLIDRRMDFLFSDKNQIEANELGQQKDVSNFPFRPTPSGHFKIQPDQVVFSSNKLSILVADPTRTNVNIQDDQEKVKPKGILPIPSKLFQTPQAVKMDPQELTKMRSTEISEDIENMTGDGSDNILHEMKLENLGYANNGYIDYSKLSLTTKTNLYHELYRRISNYVNTDVQVVIGQEEFSCHLMVLQAYSEYFETQAELRRIILPQNEVSVNAFIVIYDWMISGKDCVTLLKRNNILEIFVAAQFLKIKELEEQCWGFLDSHEVFTEDTAFMLYIEAKKLNILEVKEIMIPRIRNFFLTLVSSQDFVELDIEEVVVLLSSNYIAVNCEMEVLMSAVRWLKADWEGRLHHLVKIMSCIRFGLISPWQLVDIKRNPENPELLEIMNVPEITKMVDDGLSFVIIKYWYGHHSEDYAHWIELLGLLEPQERNWAGNEKNYVTYREFLAFLDTYRQDNILQKNKTKLKKLPPVHSVQACYPPPDLVSPTTSTDKDIPLQAFNMEHIKKKSYTVSTEEGSRTPTTATHSLTEEEAASVIQSAYRNFKQSKYTKRHNSEQSSPNVDAPKSPNEKKTPTNILSQNSKVLSMFTTQRSKPENTRKTKAQEQKYLVKGSLYSNDRESVLIFGGLDPHTSYGVNKNTGKDIYRYLPEMNCWDYVGELPEPRQHHSTAFFRGRVYLAGGGSPISADGKDKGVVVNSVWSFEPITRTWYRESSMITARKNFGLVVSHMKLYAIGGQDKYSKMLTSVERFEPGGKWEEVAPLKIGRMGMACTKYRDCIWVAGGMCGSKKNPLTSVVECYDTRKNQWTQIENIRFPRVFASLFAMNDRLYLIGGAGRISEKDKNTSSVSAIDVWDARDRQWKLKTELSIPRHGHCVAYLGTQILIMGGVTTVYMRALSNIECYCVERFTWVRGITPLPTTLSGHSSVVLPPASLM